MAPAYGPELARVVALSLRTKIFDKARASLDSIARQHQGYLSDIRFNSRQAAGRTLNATLHLPADRLDSAIAELKSLGHVEEESQASEDTGDEAVSINAQLLNARAKQQRLLEVEKEIASTREEIGHFEARLRKLQSRVHYATVQITLWEEYHVPLNVYLSGLGTRLSDEASNGLRRMVTNVVALVGALLRYGPTLVFWALLLWWPGKLAWRRLRARAQ